jgi:RNA polymerase sigma factor (sigma-70 family)
MPGELKKPKESSINDILSAGYDRLHKWTVGFVKARGGDRNRAEDLLHEACVKILKLKDPHKSQIRKPLAYLARIIRNDFPKLKRTEQPLTETDLAALECRDTRIDHVYQSLYLKELIQQLDDENRKVWFLKKRDERTWNEIGRLLGVPPEQVKKRFLRRIAQLRDEVIKEANVKAQSAKR